jgi:lysophospholipase L1-like esterase
MTIARNSTWVLVGDSITACQRDINKPNDLGTGYVSLAAGMLSTIRPDHRLRIFNRGVPGDTVRELHARWQSDVLDLAPDWLSVCIGINDVWQQFDGKHEGQSLVSLSEYRQTLDALLSGVRPSLKGLILMAPYCIRPPADPMRAAMDSYAEALRELAQRHRALFFDTQAVFDQAEAHASCEYLSTDTVHLTVAGNVTLALAVLRSVDSIWPTPLGGTGEMA